MTRLLIALTMIPAALIGCGGGGGGSTASQVLDGVFVDSAVQGLEYQTSTQSGTTDSSGKFKYKNGETIQFKLYGTNIQSVVAHSLMTPFDFDFDSITNADYPINLIRFLLTVDTDNDSTNGIQLPTFSGTFLVNFDQDLFAFETDANVLNFLTAYASGRSLPSVVSAINHFNQTLTNSNDSFVLDLTGKTGTSEGKYTNSYCSNNFTRGWSYVFEATSMRMLGNDSFNTVAPSRVCSGGPVANNTITYSSLSASDGFAYCLPRCTYKQINRLTYISSDNDGREAFEYTWYTPSSNKINSIKRILNDPNNPGQPAAKSTFKEIISIN